MFSGLDFDTILVSDYVWKQNDSLHKLSQMFYNTYEYWWVIAWWNSYGVEADVKNGALLTIPINLTDALKVLGV